MRKVIHTLVIYKDGKRHYSECLDNHRTVEAAARCSQRKWSNYPSVNIDSWTPQWSIDQKKFLTRVYGVMEDTPPIGQISYLILNK